MTGEMFARTHGWDAVLFPAGVRLSTWAAAALFLAAAVILRDSKPLLAGFAWLAGFEAAYQATALLTGEGLPAAHAWAVGTVPVGAAAVVVAHRAGVRVSAPLMAAVAAVWAVWVLVGFPANSPASGFDPGAEVLNELCKSLWAAAYLLPLLTSRRPAAAPAAGMEVS